ncbi:MAG: ABC transporter ATP-binding protein [Chloroflexota bacterium]
MQSGGWRRYLTYDETKGKAKIDGELLWRVFGYARPHLTSIAIVLVTIIAISFIELIPPLLYRELIDNVLPNRDFSRLNLLAAGMLLIPITSGLANVLQRYFSAKAGEGIIFDLRGEMYSHLQGMSIRFFTDTKAGEIVSRFNNDVVGAQNAISGTIPNLITNSVTLITTLIVMLTIEWRLAVLAVAVLPLFLLPTRRVGRILREIRKESLEHKSAMNNSINDTLTINGALLVKTFGRQRQELSRFNDANGAVRDIGIRQAIIGRWFFMGLSMAATIGTALIYWVGGYLVLSDAISVGTIVAFVAYLGRLYGPLTSLTNVHVEFATSMVSFERVFEYLDLPIEIKDRSDAKSLKDVRGEITFEQVSFRYRNPESSSDTALEPPNHEHLGASNRPLKNGIQPPDVPSVGAVTSQNPAQMAHDDTDRLLSKGTDVIPQRLWALEEVSFKIEPGQLVALVGPSGAGKTTITYLLPRLYDPTHGQIKIDGYDLRELTQESVAQQIGIVTQESYLFHDTIRANLLYARPQATDKELDAACRAANIYTMIAGLPDGYDTIVGERGYRLSGGEKQRLAIARVILKDPRILIMDEATSHLDSQSEALIQAALEPLLAERTSLVIAHRLSTILAADKIVVLDQGRIVESGTHQELLAQNGLYTDLYETQFWNKEKIS